jgi:hypothetical protein
MTEQSSKQSSTYMLSSKLPTGVQALLQLRSAKHASPDARTPPECAGRASPLLEELCSGRCPSTSRDESHRERNAIEKHRRRHACDRVVVKSDAPHDPFGERPASPALSAPDLRRIHAMRTRYPHERGVRTPLASIRFEKLRPRAFRTRSAQPFAAKYFLLLCKLCAMLLKLFFTVDMEILRKKQDQRGEK